MFRFAKVVDRELSPVQHKFAIEVMGWHSLQGRLCGVTELGL